MPNGESGNNNIVAIVAIIVIAALAIAFFVYALPMLQPEPEEQPADGGNVEINIPTPVREEPSEPAPSNQYNY